ncbi:SDR family NAD(P)-dependent oxidoreductase [Pseudomonas chlororaphis]|uniref:type I polyketide synthase n=1 Tax=Pseudomonas chlororaphis TaxID=587753 RepID=UPI0006A5FED6|nr:SDR family NAD(P)-dependent oxidoreductase [Pseudomonas chlororaphis]AZC31810.1 Modular polyketide synthase [Pseudomonas chlororaphis subsp. piscium]WDG77652.1 SDR family NAD(P)-dependent oxidoreductase [Pseudomonas chlororaphis]WDG83111.1 SDR family NAD(P)-dependent oxidoreductase [Pseudomonas chlororaphis]WDG89576.1 SDR family NAD(P)-dependent oxidoreductase [Pseudomonas chlororaphis]SDS81877.1 Phosphopantetheine attachment site [Pseudomonas chlororaphis]
MSTNNPTRLMHDALIEIERLQRKLGGLEQQLNEPVAVLGMGCRFSGADSPEELWQLLLAGTDGVRAVPADRWDSERYFDADPDSAGHIYCRTGSFLDDIASFDPGFFGISAREATMLDPQQRILLEVVWEAVERSGIPASALKGSATGVFVGVMHQDYAHRIRNAADVDLYSASGNAASVLAGRISHVLGLHGPSITLDTACSSSLVAVHLACAALRAGECDIAIVGGVNVVLSPVSTAAECRAHMLSASGRCRPFDDSADGFVRGEGCGVVVLQRLSDATAAGRSIDALIAGSAVNHDGRSAGLTVPNEHAQRELIRAALRAANIDAQQVQYVEAHGTGTSLGDPIEAAALASVFANRAKGSPVLLGSIKSNLGHLEGAAGIAGLIKAILCVRHGVVPATLHVLQPNRGVDWRSVPLRLARQNEQMSGALRVAGVSSFGFSGTNAHALVVAAPVSQAVRGEVRFPQLLTVSAKSAASLLMNAVRFAEHLSGISETELEDVCFSSRVARTHFSHRLAVVASSAQEMANELRRFALGEQTTVVSGLTRAMSPARDVAGEALPETLEAIAQGYVLGAPVDLTRLAPERCRIVSLPTYAFDRQKYWLDEQSGATQAPPLYRIAWKPIPLVASALRSGRRIIAGNDPQLCGEIAAALEAAGEQCTVVGAEVETILGAGNANLGVMLVVAGSLATTEPLEAITQYGALIIELAQALALNPSLGPVVVVTRGATFTGPAEEVDPVVSAINAAVRVARREQGALWGRSVDIDGSQQSLATLAAMLGTVEDGEEEVAIRAAVILVPRLRRTGTCEVMPDIAADGVYVITGGTGALGLASACWLASRGARHLLLISRRGEQEQDVRASCDQLRSDGVDVRVACADVADEVSLRSALALADRPVRGVIHCAGVIDDSSLVTMTSATFAGVLRAKVGGADLLDRLTVNQPVDLFLLFSSISVALGRHGQAAYAAANAYLDALSQQRCLHGRPALSVGWGLWAAGMGTTDPKVLERMRASGLQALTETEAFGALEKAFNVDAHLIIAAIDTQRIASQPNLPRLLEGMVGGHPPMRRPVFDFEQLRGHSADARRALIAEYLGGELQFILSSDVELSHDMSLIELGMDSLTGSELRNAIERSTGVYVPMQHFIDGSPLNTVVEVIVGQLERRLVTTQSVSPGTSTEKITL